MDRRVIELDTWTIASVLCPLVLNSTLALALLQRPRNILLRLVCIGILYTPLVLLEAQELVWLFLLQCVLVWIEIRAIKMWIPIGKSNDLPSTAERRNFTLGNLLLITTLVAGVVVLAKSTPSLNRLAWQSLAMIAVASSWTTTMAWLVVTLKRHPLIVVPLALVASLTMGQLLSMTDWLLATMTNGDYYWPPGPDVYTKGGIRGRNSYMWLALIPALLGTLCICRSSWFFLARNDQAAARNTWKFSWQERAMTVALISAVVIYCGWIGVESWRHIPARSKSAERARLHDDLLAARARIEQTQFVVNHRGHIDLVPSFELPGVINELETELATLREIVRHPAITQLRYSYEADFAGFRDRDAIPYALMTMGDYLEAHPRSPGAFEYYLTAVEYSVKSREGLLLSTWLRGIPYARMALIHIRQHLSGDKVECMQAIERLIAVNRLREAPQQILDRGRAWTLSKSWHRRLQHVHAEASGLTLDEFPLALVQEDWNELSAEFHLTLYNLALRAYYLDHQCYPQQLSELVPAYLPELMFNPSKNGAPYHYELKGNEYGLD